MIDVDTYLDRCYDILLQVKGDINSIPDDEFAACTYMVKHYEEEQKDSTPQLDKTEEATGT